MHRDTKPCAVHINFGKSRDINYVNIYCAKLGVDHLVHRKFVLQRSKMTCSYRYARTVKHKWDLHTVPVQGKDNLDIT